LAKVSELKIKSIIDKIKNIEDTYNDAFDYLDSETSLHSAQRNLYTNHQGYMSTSVYDILLPHFDEELETIDKKKQLAEEGLRKMEAELDWGIKQGIIVEGDETWQQMQAGINKFKE